MLLAALLLPFLQVSLAATYTLQHRILVPSAYTEAHFKTYGTIALPDSDGSTSNAGEARIVRTDEGKSGVGGAIEGSWYQVLLTGDGLGEGIMTSTKACYLYTGEPSIILHRHNDRPTGIDLVPHSSVPADGSCPHSSATALFNPFLNSEVVIKSPSLMFGPDLAPPIPVSTAPGGGPVTPPEEKSFLQKYWLPLLGVGFFVVSQLAPDDKPQQAGGAART